MTDLTSPSPGGCSKRGVIRIGVVLAAFQSSLLVTSEKGNRVKWFCVHHFNQAAVTHTKHVKLIHDDSPIGYVLITIEERSDELPRSEAEWKIFFSM